MLKKLFKTHCKNILSANYLVKRLSNTSLINTFRNMCKPFFPSICGTDCSTPPSVPETKHLKHLFGVPTGYWKKPVDPMLMVKELASFEQEYAHMALQPLTSKPGYCAGNMSRTLWKRAHRQHCPKMDSKKMFNFSSNPPAFLLKPSISHWSNAN